MTWEELQPYLKKLNGRATVIVSRKKIIAIMDNMWHTEACQLQDAVVNCSGVKDAKFTGYIGFVYRIPDPNGKGTIGKVPTVALEGRLIYSKDDVDRRPTKEIIVPIEAIEAISA